MRFKDYSTGTCTEIDGKGDNKETLCHTNSFLTGIRNPYGRWDVSTLTTSKYNCCKLEYQQTSSGDMIAGLPLGEEFYNNNYNVRMR